MRFLCLMVVLVAFAPLMRADEACIQWDLYKDVPINRRQVVRLYDEALRWVDQNVSTRHDNMRPCITIHVGQPCPDQKIKHACASPVAGDVYVPDWNPLSAATVAQATLSSALLRLMDAKDISAIAEELYAEDRKDFVDYLADKSPDHAADQARNKGSSPQDRAQQNAAAQP